MRTLLVVVVWSAATATALLAAWQTRVGSVVLSIGVSHGVHMGDIVAFAIAYTWATVITMAILGSRRG